MEVIFEQIPCCEERAYKPDTHPGNRQQIPPTDAVEITGEDIEEHRWQNNQVKYDIQYIEDKRCKHAESEN